MCSAGAQSSMCILDRGNWWLLRFGVPVRGGGGRAGSDMQCMRTIKHVGRNRHVLLLLLPPLLPRLRTSWCWSWCCCLCCCCCCCGQCRCCACCCLLLLMLLLLLLLLRGLQRVVTIVGNVIPVRFS